MLIQSDALSFLPCQLMANTPGVTTLDVTGLRDFRPEIAMTYRERVLADPARMEVVQALRAVAGELSAQG